MKQQPRHAPEDDGNDQRLHPEPHESHNGMQQCERHDHGEGGAPQQEEAVDHPETRTPLSSILSHGTKLIDWNLAGWAVLRSADVPARATECVGRTH